MKLHILTFLLSTISACVYSKDYSMCSSGSYRDGENCCYAKGGRLATIKNAHDQETIENYLSTANTNKATVFIGFDDRSKQDVILRSDGSLIKQNDFHKWKNGNSSSPNRSKWQNCRAAQTDTGRWNWQDCASSLPALCETAATPGKVLA